ncbi:MAG: carbamoyl-phosphate synthase small subunit [Rubritepida sp.]|nr:carbamoyl-phosphate synthase small subunit [Rubritepida sp.]
MAEIPVSLTDGSNNTGVAPRRHALFVQFHPKARPGPSDSHYPFHSFVGMMDEANVAASSRTK